MTRLRTAARNAALLLGLAGAAACGDKGPQDILATVPGSRIKFFNFGIGAPGVNFYANDTKVTAINSVSCQAVPAPAACASTGVEATTGVATGGAASGGFYSAIDPGQYTFSSRIAGTTDANLPIATAAATLADGKAYSFYVAGRYDATAKKAEAFVVEDPIPADVDFTVANVRFVNAISNSQPLQLVLRNATTGVEATVGAAVPYKGASTFVPFGDATPVFVNSGGLVDLNVRAAGSSTNLFTRVGVSFLKGRVYTVSARGDITVTSTTAADRPQLDVTANR